MSSGGADRRKKQKRGKMPQERRVIKKGKGEREEDGGKERKQGREQKAPLSGGKAEKRRGKAGTKRSKDKKKKCGCSWREDQGVIKSVGPGSKGNKALRCRCRHLILTKAPLVGKDKSQLCK